MTGQRARRRDAGAASGRGGGDPWRGERPDSDQTGAPGPAEVEELSVRAVIRRPGGRIGASTAVAVVVLLTLIGAGFGVLGGRSVASPAAVAAGSAVPSAGPGRTPLVTPASSCGPLPAGDPPGVLLTVGDQRVSAQVDVGPATANPTPGPDRQPIDIPADAVAEIRIAAGACATGWHIAVWSPSDGLLRPLAVVPNPDGDPGLALQNRFELLFAPLRDLVADGLELRAALQLPGREILARWPIRILPFDRPVPRLVAGRDTVLTMVEGCDVVLTFSNGYEEHRTDCDEDLSAAPAPPTRLRPGTPMSLDFDGWSIGDTRGYCGATSDRAFLLMSTPGCEQHPPHGKSFTAPRSGDWTFAVGACAIKAGNEICGTWFASIDTR